MVPQVASSLAGESPLPTPTAMPTPTPTLQPTPDGVPRQVAVPILMYHHVGEIEEGFDSLRRNLTVSPEALRQQLDYLLQHGYQVVSLEAVLRYLALGEPLPERPVVLTFDDGYRDAYDLVFPILREYGVTATFFLVTAPIDQGSPDYVTWDQVREMSEAGMEFGAHTYTHPDLTDKDTDYVVWQVVGSQEAIEERVGHEVRYFAYPSGAYDEHAVAVVRSAGFWVAVTTEYGCSLDSDSLFTLARVRVRPQDTLLAFARKLETCAQ